MHLKKVRIGTMYIMHRRKVSNHKVWLKANRFTITIFIPKNRYWYHIGWLWIKDYTWWVEIRPSTRHVCWAIQAAHFQLLNTLLINYFSFLFWSTVLTKHTWIRHFYIPFVTEGICKRFHQPPWHSIVGLTVGITDFITSFNASTFQCKQTNSVICDALHYSIWFHGIINCTA